jgi:hypothetical protein
MPIQWKCREQSQLTFPHLWGKNPKTRKYRQLSARKSSVERLIDRHFRGGCSPVAKGRKAVVTAIRLGQAEEMCAMRAHVGPFAGACLRRRMHSDNCGSHGYFRSFSNAGCSSNFRSLSPTSCASGRSEPITALTAVCNPGSPGLSNRS